MPNNTGVDSYHVNVKVGDCAIHLLVQLNPNKKSEVLRAVLVDGGPSPRGSSDENPIIRLVEWLSKRYEIKTQNKLIQFDTIVITHWNKDHYGGVFDAILKYAKDRKEVPWLKYSSGGDPETVMFCPNWDGKKEENKWVLDGAPTNLLKQDAGKAFINRLWSSAESTAPKDDKDWIAFGLLKTADENIGGKLSDVLGANFFEPATKPTTAHLSGSPAELRASNSNSDLPTMSCIACMGEIMGKPAKTASESVAKTSQYSIVAIIQWESGRISHYFGGDADQATEQLVVGWLSKKPGDGKVTSMKLSHHGSKNSTPLEPSMLDAFRPLNVFISNPDGSYVHPSWEIMLCLHGWAISNDYKTRIFALKFPWYLALSKEGGYTFSGEIDTSSFDDPEADKPFRKAMDDFYAKINKIRDPSQKLITEYTAYTELKNQDKTEWLLDQVDARWKCLGFPGEEAHPSTGAGHVMPSQAQVDANNAVDCLLIESRDDDATDGGVAYKHLGLSTLHRFARPGAKVAENSTKCVENPTVAHSAAGGFPLTGPPLGGKPKKPDDKLALVGGKGPRAKVGLGRRTSGVIVNSSFSSPPGTDPNERDNLGKGGKSRARAVTMPPALAPPTLSPRKAPVPEKGFFLYSNRIPTKKIGVGTDSYVKVKEGTPLDGFVGALHYGVVCLAAAPPSGTDPATTLLLESDEMGAWLMDAIGARDVAVTNSGAGAVSGFEFGVEIKEGSEGQVLIFSTAAASDAFTVDVPDMGYLEDSDTIVFGLDTRPPPPPDIVLSDLVDYLGLQEQVGSLTMAALGDLKLKLSGPAAVKGNRNAVWFEPSNGYKTTLRLQYDIDNTTLFITSGLLSQIGADIKLDKGFVIGRRTAMWSTSAKSVAVVQDGSIAFGLEMTVLSKIPFEAIIEPLPSAIRLQLTLKSDISGALETILEWLASKVGLAGQFDFQGWLKKAAGKVNFAQVCLRRVVMVFGLEDAPGNKANGTLEEFGVEMEVKLNFGGTKTALFLVSFNWAGGTGGALSADLWTAPPIGDAKTTIMPLLPGYESYMELSPVTILPSDLGPTLDLTALAGWEGLPEQIPTQIAQAGIKIGSDGISFSGNMLCKEPEKTDDKAPEIPLGKIELAASYAWGAETKFEVSLAMTAIFMPPANSKYGSPIEVSGSIVKDKDGWVLKAGVENLFGSTIIDYFGASSRDGVLSVIESLFIKKLDIEYTYASKGGSPGFTFNGILMLGTHELDLTFKYKDKGWTFNAKAIPDIPDIPSTTVGKIVESILGELDTPLPPFVANISVKPPKAKNDIGLEIVADSLEEGQKQRNTFFTAYVDIEGFKFQFIQSRINIGDKPTLGPVRRVFVASIHQLPSVVIPLVGDVTQPFDEMLYMWVQPAPKQKGSDGKSNTDDPPVLGLTYADLKYINAKLEDLEQKPLPFKFTKAKDKQGDGDVLVQAGSHFMLVLNDAKGVAKVALDYQFASKKKTKPPKAIAARTAVTEVVEDSDVIDIRTDDDTTDSGSAMGSYSKTIGPLSIQNMGLKFSTNGDESSIGILLDASITLGPITFSLLGFSITLPFTSKNSLQNLPEPKFALSGMSAAFDRPPILLAGLFEHGFSKDTEYYQGALIVSYMPWLFQAAGYYGETTPPDQEAFKSFFAFARLNGPLITLEFAQISGITGGFGYNTSLAFPTVENVLKFPFLIPMGGSTPGPDGATAKDTLANLLRGGWFAPKNGSFWLAAGLTVDAMEILTVQAVVVIEWDPKVKLGLFGVATADIPPGKGVPKFAHVQLGVVATVDFAAGIMKIEGQLTPASYIIDRNCHLTGGFALYSWFGSRDPELQGQWVFTIGGYHSAFRPPPQYPNPPRLAISWNFNGNISITGQAYFAITPKMCMGGGRLDVSLALGPLSAWFNAYADFLINYKPFFFQAEGGLSVGVAFTLDLWIVTIRISVEIGATLYIQGPPFGGTVHVDFWVFGFDINFGASAGPIAAVSLGDFFKMVMQDSDKPGKLALLLASGSEEATTEGEPATTSPHVFTVQSGLIPNGKQESTPSGQPWNVRGAVFSFSLATKFAINQATLVTGVHGDDPPPPTVVPGTGGSIYAKPMRLTTPLTSAVTVTITQDLPPEPKKLMLNGVEIEEKPNVPVWNQAESIIKAVPNALWGLYKPSEDPTLSPSANKNSSALNGTSDNTTNLMMGLTIYSPVPLESPDLIESFNVRAAMAADALSPAPPFPTTVPKASDPAWAPIMGNEGNRFEEVVERWQNPLMGAGVAQKAVDLWQKTWGAGWDLGEGERLEAGCPGGLMEGFDDFYLEAPRLGVVMA
ncbi:hypothetical protein FGG08_004950 [Glutinoglossum americanum]|uniref:DUF6603 domain-containing protein n=1 Tax=Glutinoglossum americanum TaxID=1670608 RepID=A0A9P8I480_9PEZI|nr:hypothetical protein FGG08_004950 [Glutinoglossum americanum]